MSTTGTYNARQFNLSGLKGSQIKHLRCTSSCMKATSKKPIT
jgi:hypothetical protein